MQFLLLFHSTKKHVYAKVLQKKHIALTVSFQNRGGIEKRKPQWKEEDNQLLIIYVSAITDTSYFI